MKVVHEPLLDEFEREGAACNYYRASGWGMLPDVASIRNQDVSAAALMHAHTRTHANALGAMLYTIYDRYITFIPPYSVTDVIYIRYAIRLLRS